jgi:hypothetical protein
VSQDAAFFFAKISSGLEIFPILRNIIGVKFIQFLLFLDSSFIILDSTYIWNVSVVIQGQRHYKLPEQ